MNWLARLFGAKPELTPEQAERLAAWKALPAPDLNAPHAASRYVVVDVETSGLNLVKDRLIAIGAVAVLGGRQIQLADSMEIILQQRRVSGHDNILIHGIGGTAQSEGIPPVDALLTFLEYLGKSPLVAFHVAFDQTMIDRALKTFLGLKFKHSWADLAYIAPALYPELARSHRSLDQWMSRFGLGNYARHSALADALSTAELMLALRERMDTKQVDSFKAMRDLDKAQRMVNWTG
ncbi:MAG: 3'-5' exonuclease [Pseudomonadota bacterium]|nr:3'-5' exonuclease [Pseudomonadota bacterium]MDP1903265.1 3'-5' exonuclease [Pseudomonadota bacterium]MDP2351217.1 3'-5' exonuclease [Pseudomonadota bacterium]